MYISETGVDKSYNFGLILFRDLVSFLLISFLILIHVDFETFWSCFVSLKWFLYLSYVLWLFVSY